MNVDIARRRCLIAILGILGLTHGFAAQPEVPWRDPGQVKDAEYLRTAVLRYSAEGHEIVGRNRTCFNNRPLYCEGRSNSGVLAGDRPFLRLVGDGTGCWFAGAIVRGDAGKWFHEYAQVESRYRCGRMTWRMSDPTLSSVEVVWEAVPLKGEVGFALRMVVKGSKAGDKFVWSCGGSSGNLESWEPTYRGNPNIFRFGNQRILQQTLAIDPDSCRGNQVTVDGQLFRLATSGGAPKILVGRADREAALWVAEASASDGPVALMKSVAGTEPILCGAIDLRSGDDPIHMLVHTVPREAATNTLVTAAPAKAFADAVSYLGSVERVQVETPDPYLDAAVAAVCHSLDFGWDGQAFCHGCMSFRIHFLGWRVICGSTTMGWHDRVKQNASFYIAHQVKDDTVRVAAAPDMARLGVHEGERSRFHGVGKISNSPGMYNTQTQFFDQTLHDWRWTADPELERMLRPALELQLQWARECFDPDDDGLYESYINVLPTDSVWYNGGGSVEESAYAYYGHVAAADMARRAGDPGAARRHDAQAKKIQSALRNVLWIKDAGHYGAYIEQGGHGRVHADAWLYSQFLPIDAGLTTPEEAIQALYYTEWALERIRLPYGGVFCQLSNWVPSKWSTRDVFNGDGWHLALAYFKTGLADEGWDLLKGFMLETAYAATVPGGFSHVGAGTDFGDSKDMFARAVVEGLFGYNPDYPNGVVRMRPAFPTTWPKASIRTPDFTFDHRQDGDVDTYRLTLSREAQVEMRLPVRAEKVRRVTLNGQDMAWKAEAGFGCTVMRLLTPKTQSADLAIELTGRMPQSDPVNVEGTVGAEVQLVCPRGEVVTWQDFHGVIDGAVVKGATIRGRLARKPGHHLVLADVKVGELPQRQVFKVRVSDDPQAEAERAARTPREAPQDAKWECLDLTKQYNGDVRTIFQQKYASPRPKTCSVRLGQDGYSPWTFPYWNNKPPAIDLSNLPRLVGKDGRLLTTQNVPFAPLQEGTNIAFTSLWDNWPTSVSVPVGRQADTAWLLICGSTFPLQLRIANAEVRFRYSDGQIEKMPLVPPWNFWMLCPWGGVDYDYRVEAFSLPKEPPPMVQLGNNCRALVLSWKLRPGVKLEDVTLETLSQDVVIGLMGVSLMNPR